MLSEHELMQMLEGSSMRRRTAGFAVVLSLLVSWSVSAETPESATTMGQKRMTVHQVKSVVGPSVQIDEQEIVSVAWVEEDKEARTILFARSEQPGGPLGRPVSVNQPTEHVYYRQESPALAVHGNEVFVTWSQTHQKITPDKPFAGELRLSRSTDGGRTFSPSILVNDDDQVMQHTFDSIQIAPDGALHMAWIDGREGKKEPGTFVARSTDHGRTIAQNFKIDDNTCVCCRTAVATSADGTVYVAWRKIFEGNIRETVVSRSKDDGRTFSPSVIVGNDQWVYPACPHRPASLGVDRQGRLYVVWYTEGADETPAIYLAYSDDQGKTFSTKKQLNRSKGTFPDHPQMAVDPAGKIAVIWEEQSPVRREVVVSYSLDRGQSFNAPVKLNEKNGQTPTVAVNQHGTVVMGWKEHAMPAHRLVIQT
ncbi:MAG TPA: sialidase family protein, partial [Nitrospira sp.]|nr:sialidase family protein [Nitrospira sp.]